MRRLPRAGRTLANKTVARIGTDCSTETKPSAIDEWVHSSTNQACPTICIPVPSRERASPSKTTGSCSCGRRQTFALPRGCVAGFTQHSGHFHTPWHEACFRGDGRFRRGNDDGSVSGAVLQWRGSGACEWSSAVFWPLQPGALQERSPAGCHQPVFMGPASGCHARSDTRLHRHRLSSRHPETHL
jgi:hypothetical protein